MNALHGPWCALRDGLRTELGRSGRYAHCVRVARLADRLAQAHGVDPRAARTAGLLHDIARLWTTERLLAECRERGLAVDAFEQENPIVLHARLGAELARERLGIEDTDVLSAIRKHTVADIEMSPLDKIVFVADGLEPGRRFEGRLEMEHLALRDLDAGLRAVYASTREYLTRRGLVPSPALLAAMHEERKSA